MKLDDFLKVKQVRCVKEYRNLTTGKAYEVVAVEDDDTVKIIDDNDVDWYDMRYFEPILDTAENPLQNIELTPEFESAETVLVYNCEVNTQDNSVNTQDNSVNTQDNSVNIQDTAKFKVGDPVYWGLKSKIFKIYRFMSTNVLEVELDGCVTAVHKDELCPATLENYGKLCSLFERIDFEQPPKELKGSDLARAMLDKGWKVVNCVCSDSSDKDALSNDECDMIDEFSILGFEGLAHNWRFAVPFDPRTGEPLTESVLDE